MDTQKVIDFLQKIIDQLGPMGNQAFHIVAGRVLAEAIVSLGFGILFTIIALILFRVIFKKTSWRNEDGQLIRIFGGIGLGVLLAFGLLIISNSLIILFSLDYATIERILNLVNGKTS